MSWSFVDANDHHNFDQQRKCINAIDPSTRTLLTDVMRILVIYNKGQGIVASFVGLVLSAFLSSFLAVVLFHVFLTPAVGLFVLVS